ncbi:uncharacterized protein LOC135931075 isoform X2 [Gordionus sp. m RMFG-2023]|uniref:uncharacterized protein LOC135931075 isoform X2 n=1 Tax=Gordionus sp. m RMFG-2023 TaxID=3053472 RepID=UPI0031FCEE20
MNDKVENNNEDVSATTAIQKGEKLELVDKIIIGETVYANSKLFLKKFKYFDFAKIKNYKDKWKSKDLATNSHNNDTSNFNIPYHFKFTKLKYLHSSSISNASLDKLLPFTKFLKLNQGKCVKLSCPKNFVILGLFEICIQYCIRFVESLFYSINLSTLSSVLPSLSHIYIKVINLYKLLFLDKYNLSSLASQIHIMDKSQLQGKVLTLVDEASKKLAGEAQKKIENRKRLYYRLKKQICIYLNRPLTQTQGEIIEDARTYCQDYIHDRLKRSGIVISLKNLPIGPANDISNQILLMGHYLESNYPSLFCNIDSQLDGTNNFLTADRKESSANCHLQHNGILNRRITLTSNEYNTRPNRSQAPTIVNTQIYFYDKNGNTISNAQNLNASISTSLINRRPIDYTTNNQRLLNGQITGNGVISNEITCYNENNTNIREINENVNWGTITALFALAGAFAVSSVLQGRIEFLPVITEKVASIFREDLALWISMQPGGWVSLVTHYKTKQRRPYSTKLLYLISLFTIILILIILLGKMNQHKSYVTNKTSFEL